MGSYFILFLPGRFRIWLRLPQLCREYLTGRQGPGQPMNWDELGSAPKEQRGAP